jgi:hypothetical protein
MLGDESIEGGWMSMQPTVISRRSFAGNGSYPGRHHAARNVLIGVFHALPTRR